MKNKSHKKQVDNYQGSSHHLKKDVALDKIIAIRLRILIAVLIAIGALLIGRLYTIQIKKHDHYVALLDKAQAPNIKVDTMRGEFFDRKGNVILSNKSINSITYYPVRGIKRKEEWEMAKRFSEAFSIKDDLKEVDLKNLWRFLNDDGKKLISKDEWDQYYDGKLKDKDIEYLKNERITDEMIAELSETDRKAFKVYYAMSTANSFQPGIVYEDAKADEIARLAENAAVFPGFSFQTTWDREVNKEIDLGSLIGSVSDIPEGKIDHYLAMGYRLNDKVGSYGLEYQYENLLSGVKSEYDQNNKSQMELIKEGRKGYDLNMSIDLDLQKKVESVLENTIESAQSEPRRAPFKQMHMVVSDPNTGDILALAAMNKGEKGYYNDPQALMLNAYPMGSTVKPATVYMGLDQGVVKPGEIINDAPMYISGTPPRHSFMNLGPVDDVSSLKLSSNIYMFHIAIRLGGSSYIPNGPLVFNDAPATYDLMRNYYSKFGLGVPTQIDFPREALGYKGDVHNSGALLEFAVGQFDNYNAMMLNQYVSTLANGGYRLKPRLVQSASNRSTQNVVYENQVEVLNEIENKEALARVTEGMRQCSV
ncbi:MAG TPA: penicillin-binding transpeptidase domain-containing protein, partial [Erysipelothrix sp.]